jgi:hypothetical protein
VKLIINYDQTQHFLKEILDAIKDIMAGVVTRHLGLYFMMIENKPKYVEVIIKRLEVK